MEGTLTSQTYPSGRTVITTTDEAGRLNLVRGTKTGENNHTFASSVSYAAHGGVTAMTLGGQHPSHNLRQSMQYNARLQTTEVKLATPGATPLNLWRLELVYNNPNMANNNGNLRYQRVYVPGQADAFNQGYLYDALNRLSYAQEAIAATLKWTQTYGYDRFGNRTSLVNGEAEGHLLPPPNNPTPIAASNRLTGFGYDAAGNVTADNQGRTFLYDAEHRQTRAVVGGLQTDYVYDGGGRRVKKVSGGQTTVFVYDAGGKLVAEYTDFVTYSAAGIQYVTADHLGSTRVLTGFGGIVRARFDYLPYGETIPALVAGRSSVAGYNPAVSINQKFTSKERDTESGLDYFLARYYSSAQGRFTSIDPADAEPGLPQDWNRYTYTLNNPLRYTDPDGEKWAVQYSDGKAIFRWYDGDTIPSDWQGEWQEYTAGWYIGSDAAIRLGTRHADDVLVLTKDLFSEQDWAKLQNANPANLTHEEREILFSGATYRADQVESMRRMAFVAELGAHVLTAGGLPKAVMQAAKSALTSLSASARRKLGNLASRAGENVADVIRSRGGNASNVRQAGPWAEKTLAETAQAAVKGDATAETAIKIAKQAGRLGKKH